MCVREGGSKCTTSQMRVFSIFDLGTFCKVELNRVLICKWVIDGGNMSGKL